MTAELKQHLDKLHSFLQSDSLGADGRIWVLGEIWDIKIDQQIDNAKSHLAG